MFLDLNGTLVLPTKQESLSEIKLILGADGAVRKLTENEFICPVVTVQSGIGKGRFTQQEFLNWFSVFFADLKMDVKGPYLCPHKFSEHCFCKKPQSLLYEQAAKDFAIDLSNSYVIGDTPMDVIAGKKIGAHSCLVRTGYDTKEDEFQEAKLSASFTGQSLGEVVDWILENETIHENSHKS